MGVRIDNQPSSVMTLVSQKAFASNAVTFSGLSGDYRYVLHLSMTVVDASSAAIEINADTTVTHYYGELLVADAAVVFCLRVNNNLIAAMDPGTPAGDYYCVADITRGNGYAAYMANSGGPSTSSIAFRNLVGFKTDATITEITSIKILKSSGTSVTGTATLYKLAAV